MNGKEAAEPSKLYRQAQPQGKNSKSLERRPDFAPANFLRERFCQLIHHKVRFGTSVFALLFHRQANRGLGLLPPTKCEIDKLCLSISLLSNSDIDRTPPRRPQNLDRIGAKNAANFERAKTRCRSISGQNSRTASSALNINRVQTKFFFQLCLRIPSR